MAGSDLHPHSERRGGERRPEPFLVPLEGAAEAIRELVEPMLESYGIELVQLHLVKGAHRATLRLFVDKKGAATAPGQGVGIDDLERMSRLVGDYLDVEDQHRNLFRGAWDLEVSSPGVDRPLTKKSHFSRAAGEEVRLKTRAPVEGSRAHSGVLVGADEAGVSIEREGGFVVLVPWDEITSAHTVFRFQDAKRPAPKRKKKSQRDRHGKNDQE